MERKGWIFKETAVLYLADGVHPDLKPLPRALIGLFMNLLGKGLQQDWSAERKIINYIKSHDGLARLDCGI